MKTLIHSIPNDVHTVAVQTLLRRRGHEVDIWYARNFPSHQKISVRIDSAGYNPRISDQLMHAEIKGEYDVCWNRRRSKVQSAGHVVEDVDKEFVTREIKGFFIAALPLVGKSAFWINDEARSLAAENKFHQLKVAQEIGFKIPDTLAGNAPADIRHFVGQQKKAIYKPMAGYGWGNKGALSLYTNTVTLDDLGSDELLQACPGIYQQYVDKAFEVRAVVMGNHVSACAIHPRDHADWRFDQISGELKCTYYALPLAVQERCIAVVKTLGLVFGCIDLIVTPEGDHVFIENNEAGQFLWMESDLEELPVLEQFVQFLISADPDFKYAKSGTPVRWAELRNSPDYLENWVNNRRSAFKAQAQTSNPDSAPIAV